MDKVRYRAIKLIFEILVGILGLIVGGGGLYFMYQINTSVSATSQAVSNAASQAITEFKSSIKADSQAINEFKSSIKADNKVEVSPTILFGEGKATVAGDFKSAIQACWYYQANYESLHPYTILWQRKGDTDYPIIRAIAEKGMWNAHTCKTEESCEERKGKGENCEVKLIGDESVIHRVEAKFTAEGDYEHIATTTAEYSSELSFGDKGRIAHRNIIKGEFKIQPEEFSETYKSKCPSKDSNDDVGNYENKLKIELESIKDEKKKDQIIEATKLYLCQRKELHENLANDGCGAVSIEPEFSVTTENRIELERPSIIFLCHKNGKKSHVRIMIRSNAKKSTSKEKA